MSMNMPKGKCAQTFFRRGAVALITATMVAGAVPATALAQASGASSDALIATQASSSYGWEVGESYRVGVIYSGTKGTMFEGGLDATVKQMIGKYFGNELTVVPQADGTFNVVFGFKEYSSAIEKIVYGDQEATPEGEGKNSTFTIKNVSSVEDPIDIKVFIGGAMTGMFDDGVAVTVTFDEADFPAAPVVDKAALTGLISDAQAIRQGAKSDDAFSALQEAITSAQQVADDATASQDAVDAAVTALQSAVDAFNASPDVSVTPTAQKLDLHVYFKGAENDGFAKQLGSQAEVTEQDDGTYQVTLNVPSLSKMDGTLGDITIGGQKADKVAAADGSATYTFDVPSLDKAYDITFGYSVDAGDKGTFTNLHPFQVAFGDADVADQVSSVDRTSLTAQIVKAEAVAKTDGNADAYAALQTAIADAYKTVDTAGLTDQQVSDATATLSAAVEAATNPTEKPTPEPGEGELEVGKTYNVPVSFLKDGGTEPSMAAGYLSDAATVTRTAEDSYDVTFRTNLTAEQKGWISNVTVDGQAVTTTEDGDNLVLSFTTADPSKTFDLSMAVQPMGGNSVSLDMVLALDKATLGELPVEQADKTELNAALEEAKGIEQGTKGDSAFADLQSAIATAQAVADDEGASQAQVDSATSALKGAIEAFNRSADKQTGATTSPTGKPSSPAAKPTTSTAKTPSVAAKKAALPKTGDVTGIVGVISTALAGLGLTGAGAFVRRHGSRKDD